MDVYGVLILSNLFVAACLSYKNKKNMKKVYLGISFFLMFFLMAFRSDNIGRDTISYLNLFKNIQSNLVNLSTDIYYEKGFLLFNIIVANFFSNDQWILIISSFIILFCIFKFIYKESKIPWLSVYLFITLMFFYNSMNIMRQYLAIACILNSFRYIKKDEITKFISWTLIASLFHSTAIVFIVLYPLSKYKITIKKIIFAYLSVTIAFVTLPTIINIVISILPKYTSYLNNVDSNKFGSLVGALIWSSIFLFLLISDYSNIRSRLLTKDENLYYWSALVSSLIAILAIKMSVLARVNFYFSIFSIVSITYVLNKLKDKQIKIILIFIIMIIVLTYNWIVLTFRPEWYNVTPFTFCF